MCIYRLAGLILATSVAAALALPAQAQQFTVMVAIHVTSSADSGPGTLRAAIAAANALPSSKAPYIYIDLDDSQPIELTSALPVITKPSITLFGTKPTRAIIDAHLGAFRILDVDGNDAQFNASDAPWVTVKHLTLQNGWAATTGGCVNLQDDSGSYTFADVELSRCVVGNASGSVYGGAIWAEGGSVDISNSDFSWNKATGKTAHGGAISLWQEDATLDISDSVFFHNDAHSTDASSGYTRGGAIRAGYATLTITDSVFRNNWAWGSDGSTNYGGAIYSERGHGTLERNVFLQNQASDGGGVLLTYGLGGDHTQGYQLVNNTFVANHATVRGGAVRDWNVDLVMRNNSFFANTSDNVSSILSFDSTASMELHNNLFAAEGGGGWCGTSANTTLYSNYNIIPAADCGFSPTANYVTTDLSLQGYRVGPNDGSKSPLTFFIDSPALDRGYGGLPDDNVIRKCPELDGLGNPRVVDGNADTSATCDIGAFEWQHEASLFADDFEDRIQPLQP